MHLEKASMMILLVILSTVLSSSQVTAQADPSLLVLESIDADRAFGLVETLVSFGSRVSGSPGYNASLFWVKSLMDQWGYKTSIEDVYVTKLGLYSSNLIAFKRGVTDRILGLSAHLDATASRDTNESAYGAVDNGSGVASLLEAAYLLANQSLQDNLVFFFFTGEEQDLDGSRVWISTHTENLSSIMGVVNFDMVGYGSQLEINWLRDLPAAVYASQVFNGLINDYDVSDVVMTEVDFFTPWVSSDQKAFWEQNIGALLVKSHQCSSYAYYHTSQDLPSQINVSLLHQAIQLAIVAAVGMANGTFDPPSVNPLVLLVTRIAPIMIIGFAGGACLVLIYHRKTRAGRGA